MTVKPGDVITMSSFNHVQPNLTAGFKAPHGRLAVFLLLGDTDKKAPESFDPGAALRSIGWFPESDFGPAEPGTGSIKDRAAELAASMKVMAALHRANEDVAAADEFAQGAELVTNMAADIERLSADAERWRFGLTVNTDDEFNKAMEPFMDWADDAAPQSAEENNAFADKAIQIARDNGLWPWTGKQVAP